MKKITLFLLTLLFGFWGNAQVTPPLCGEVFTDVGGLDGGYPAGSDSVVTICPENDGEMVTVTFTSFNIYPNYDGMYIYDGPDISSPMIPSGNGGSFNFYFPEPGAYWGSVSPGSFEATGESGCLTFHFFSSNNETGSTGWVANVTCGLPTTCEKPTGITSANPTENSIDVSWTPVGDASQWKVFALPCGTDAPTATTGGGFLTDVAAYSFTDLDPITCYQIYVMAICSETASSGMAGPYTASTLVIPPACGGQFTDDGGANGVYTSGANSIVTICPEDEDDVVTVTFNEFEISADSEAGLYIFDGDSIEATQIASENGTGSGSFTETMAGAFWGTGSPGMVEATSASGCLTFQFVNESWSVGYPGWQASVICAPPPTCPRPSAVALYQSSDTTIRVSWTPVGPANQWIVVGVPCGSPIPAYDDPNGQLATIAPTPEAPFLLSGLEALTCYDVYVFAICSDTDHSTPTNAKSGTTQIAPPLCGELFTDAGGVTGNYALGTDSVVTICPENNTEKVIVTFTQFSIMEGYDGMYVYDGDSLLAPPLLSENPAGYDTITSPGAFWGMTSPGIVEATSASGCLTFHFLSNVYVENTGWTAEVACVPVGSCQKPTAVILQESTDTTIALSWTAVGQATQWMVVPVPCGSPVPTVDNPAGQLATSEPTAENPFVLTALEPTTCFEVYVFAVCSGTDSSDPTIPIETITVIDAQVCGGIFTDTGGADGNYPGDSNSIVVICPENEEDAVTVNFTEFLLQTGYDGMYIYDGNSVDAPPILSQNLAGNTPELALPGAFWGTDEIGSITSSSADGCLTFHFSSISWSSKAGWYATITCNLAPTCPKPTWVSISDPTETSITVAWEETGTALQWEVLVIPYSDPEPDASTTGWQVANSQTFTYEGLSPSAKYKVYVRALCGENDLSAPSYAVAFSTSLTNDDCSGAIEVPVNADINCGQVAHGILTGATNSAATGITSCAGSYELDVWFKFTATATTHTVSAINISGTYYYLAADLYSGSCDSLAFEYCLEHLDSGGAVATNLTPGTTYYVLFADPFNYPSGILGFDVCIGTPPAYVTVDSTYTPEQLVQDVLIPAGCGTVSNITSFTGSEFGSTYGIAYFNSNGANFGIEEGLILTTCDVNNTPGPNNSILHEIVFGGTWEGDAETGELYEEAAGLSEPIYGVINASKIEFDFTPATPVMSFDYIFASDGYGYAQCNNANTFAFILTDLTAGTDPVNYALVPNSSLPVSEQTIRDQAINFNQELCESVNENYFGEFYGYNNFEALTQPAGALPSLGSPTNFAGLTVPLKALADVVPGHNYHVKLVVTKLFSSKYDGGAYIGKFNLGQVDLGESTVTLCDTPNYEIVTGLDPEAYSFSWIKDDEVLPGEDGPSLTVVGSGVYSVESTFNGGNCSSTDTVTVQFLDPILLDEVNDVFQCSAFEVPIPSVGHYYTEADGQGEVLDGTSISEIGDTTVYLYAANELDCFEQESFVVTIATVPILPEFTDVASCGVYSLPQIENVSYYEEPGGTGTAITSVAASEMVYAYMAGATADCSAEQSFEVVITELPQLEISGHCEVYDYILDATVLNMDTQLDYTYIWTTTGGEILSGEDTASVTVSGQGTYTVTVMVSQDCNGEAQIVVAGTTCMIQKGLSVNGDGKNDVFNLDGFGVQKLEIYNRYGMLVYDRAPYTNQWGGQSNNGDELPDGTYYYVIGMESATPKTGWIYINREN